MPFFQFPRLVSAPRICCVVGEETNAYAVFPVFPLLSAPRIRSVVGEETNAYAAFPVFPLLSVPRICCMPSFFWHSARFTTGAKESRTPRITPRKCVQYAMYLWSAGRTKLPSPHAFTAYLRVKFPAGFLSLVSYFAFFHRANS